MSEGLEELLTQEELAERLGVSARTLERWRSENQGPAYIQLVSGGAVRYCVSDVNRWLDTQRVSPRRGTARVEGFDNAIETWSSHRAPAQPGAE